MMKWLRALALLLALPLASPAHAQRLVSKDLYWQHQHSANASITGISAGMRAGRDTLLLPLAVGTTDTTDAFSPEGWYIPGTPVDSVTVGKIVIGTDSSAVVTQAATSATVNIDVSVDGVNWQSTGSTTFTSMASADKVFAIPLVIRTKALLGGIGNNNWVDLWPLMRLRIVPIGGVFTAAHCKLVYLAPLGTING